MRYLRVPLEGARVPLEGARVPLVVRVPEPLLYCNYDISNIF